jgi:hypothetical protein
MSKKQIHPDIELFDFLNVAVDQNEAKVIEAHLSTCEECGSIASLVRAFKRSASEQTNADKHQVSSPIGVHPDISTLASFYYAQSNPADTASVRSHVAFCSSCAEAISEYARAERAAAEYELVKGAAAREVPAKAWELIRDWEESSFGKLKPANEVLGQDLLDRLSGLLNKAEIREERHADRSENAERVPVLIVSSSGEVRSLEYFDKTVDPTGVSVLKHAEGSARFDNKPVHALFDFGDNRPLVITNLIRRDSVRLEPARPGAESRRADYIIIED